MLVLYKYLSMFVSCTYMFVYYSYYACTPDTGLSTKILGNTIIIVIKYKGG